MVADWWDTRRWSSRRHKRSDSALSSSKEETSGSGVKLLRHFDGLPWFERATMEDAGVDAALAGMELV